MPSTYPPPDGVVLQPGETPTQTLARYMADYHSPNRDQVIADLQQWVMRATYAYGAAPDGIVPNPSETPPQVLARFTADYHSPNRNQVLADLQAWVANPTLVDAGPCPVGGQQLGESPATMLARFVADYHAPDAPQVIATLTTWEAGKTIPAPPSFDALTSINMKFMGGNVINSPVYGLMPWWDAALSWCDPATRALVYACKRQTGETHCIVDVPSGGPLYDEGGQFYSPDRFPALDWTSGLTALSPAFDTLVKEIIQQGFYPCIFTGDGDPVVSTAVGLLVAQRLKDLGLTNYCVTFPGYDGVFYGWTPQQIQDYASQCKAINPAMIFGLEFQPGKIPLGGGAGDYALDGPMQDYDVICAECNDFVPYCQPAPGNVFWQVVGRCVSPYISPSDADYTGQTPPPMPFYLTPSARGTRKFVFFETDEPYNWVRLDMTTEVAIQTLIAYIEAMRGYARNCGVHYTG